MAPTTLHLTPKSTQEVDFYLHHPERIPLPRHFPQARVPGFVPNPSEATIMIATAMQGDPAFTLAGDDQLKMRAYLKLVFDRIYWAPQLTSLVLEYLGIIVICYMTKSWETRFLGVIEVSDLDDEEEDCDLDGEEEDWGLDGEEEDWGLDGEEEKGEVMETEEEEGEEGRAEEGGVYVPGTLPSDSLGSPRRDDLAMWRGARGPVLAKL